ncbi:MAG: DUF6263 family protein [Bacteroidales bacterium]|jgi:hypothetical protein|nr:DUF6263 family protein [Bacteroidales bacterium]
MKSRSVRTIVFTALFIIISGLYSVIYSQSGAAELKLAYNYPAGTGVNYMVSTVMAQVMDIQGQTMQNDVYSAFGFSVKGAGNQDANLKLEIVVDTLGQTTMSPMGGSGGAVSDVKGKSCFVVVSPDGKMIDLTGAEEFKYIVDGTGESNLGQALADFFPRLPDKPVNAGDTWIVQDSVMSKSPSSSMKIVFKSEYRLESIENTDGVETAKVSITSEGKITQSMSAQGMDLYLSGPYTSTSEFTFAVKEGFFQQQTINMKMTGDLEIPSMSMVMPITLDMKTVAEKK